MPPAPTDAQLVELHDRLWNDPRRRDDRSEFFECEHCGGAIRWIANLGSRRGSSIQVIARPISTAACFSPSEHAGLVAVFRDRTGFTVSRFTAREDIEDALLYRCHWDACDEARRVRDRIHRERNPHSTHALRVRADAEDSAPDDDALLRYAQWRSER